MKRLPYILGGLAIGALLFIGVSAHAQVSTNYWKLLGGVIQPNIASWMLEMPYLANLNCIGTNSSGLFQAGTCGGGGGSSLGTTTPWVQGQVAVVASTSALYSIGTTTPTLGLGLSGTLTTISDVAQSLSLSTSSLYSGMAGQLPYFSGTNTISATSTGLVTCTGTASCGAGSYVAGNALTIVGGGDTFGYPFTPTSYGASTSTVMAFLGGLISNGSTTIPTLGNGTVNANNGLLYGTATSTATLGLGLSYSSTLGQFIGGTSGSLTISTSSLYTGANGNLAYFSGTNAIQGNTELNYSNGGGTPRLTVGSADTPTFAFSDSGGTTVLQPTSGNFTITLPGASGTICLTTTCSSTGLATTSPISAGNLLEYSSVGSGSAFGIATGTLSTGSTGLTLSGTPTLVNGGSSLSGTLVTANGGTGTTTWQTGSIPFFNGSNFTENNPLLFWSNSTDELGVGTSSPSKILTVEGTQSGGVARIQRDYSSPPANSVIGTYDVVLNEIGGLVNLTGPGQTFGVMSNGGSEDIQAEVSSYRDGADTSGGFQIGTYNSGSFFNGMTINHLQQVGIGSTSPTSLLSVLGGGTYNSQAASNLLTVASSSAGTATTTFLNISSAGTITTNLSNGFVQSSAGVLSAAALTSGQVTTALGFTPFGGTNPLPIANGGTATTTGGVTNAVEYYNGTTLTNGSGFVFNGTQVGISSSTPKYTLSIGTAASAFYINSSGEVVGYDTNMAVAGQITPARYPAFKMATTTTWTGSTSEPYDADIIAPFTGTVNTIVCKTDAGTLTLEAKDGGTAVYLVSASTTANTNSFSLSFTKGDQLQFIAGNPASSPTWVSCTLGTVQTP